MSPHCQSPVWLQEAPEAGTSSGRALEPLASRGASGRGPRQLDLGWPGIARSWGPVGTGRRHGTTGVTGDSVSGG